ncbi:uncharacterized protein LOC144437171 [Glandiceps talaboti]
MWMEYIMGPVLPAPFNLIPNYLSIIGIIKRFRSILRKVLHNKEEDEEKFEGEDCTDELAYNELMRILVMRYTRAHFEIRQDEALEEISRGSADTDEKECSGTMI